MPPIHNKDQYCLRGFTQGPLHCRKVNRQRFLSPPSQGGQDRTMFQSSIELTHSLSLWITMVTPLAPCVTENCTWKGVEPPYHVCRPPTVSFCSIPLC